MTDFEKSIKRNVDKALFEKIRDHQYGDGKNTFNYTYGDVASWITWNRDAQGNLSGNKIPSRNIYIQYDGELNWDKDVNLPLEHQFSKRLTTDVVFVGLNMAGDGTPLDWSPFSNARGHGTIIDIFKDTAAEGGYFTDIIKPDSRFLDKIGKPSKSEEVMEIVRERPDVLKEHIRLFKEEIDFIRNGKQGKPLLIVYGNEAEWILNEGFRYGILDRNQFTTVLIWHYAYVRTPADHKIQASRELTEYITIPVDANYTESRTTETKRTGKVITVPLKTKAHAGSRNRTIPQPAINQDRAQLITAIRNRGYISIDDEITFHTITDVLNDLFDKGFQGYQRAVCHVDFNHDAWFPKLDYIKNGKQHPSNTQWHNYFADNQNMLVEYPTKTNNLQTLVWPPQQFEPWEPYVFARHEGSYRFFGKYEQQGKIATAGELGLTVEILPDDPVVVFKRVGTTAALPKNKFSGRGGLA